MSYSHSTTSPSADYSESISASLNVQLDTSSIQSDTMWLLSDDSNYVKKTDRKSAKKIKQSSATNMHEEGIGKRSVYSGNSGSNNSSMSANSSLIINSSSCSSPKDEDQLQVRELNKEECFLSKSSDDHSVKSLKESSAEPSSVPSDSINDNVKELVKPKENESKINENENENCMTKKDESNACHKSNEETFDPKIQKESRFNAKNDLERADLEEKRSNDNEKKDIKSLIEIQNSLNSLKSKKGHIPKPSKEVKKKQDKKVRDSSQLSKSDKNGDSQRRKSRPISTEFSEKEIDEQIEKQDAETEMAYHFNTNPRKNIGKLCAFYKVEETPENIAHVIRTTKGLLGEQIGDYLARKESEPILTAYFREVDMKCGFIEAMRRSLEGPMFLPGEGQMIDRVMQSFANIYVEQNPESSHNPDAFYVLAFALIMLNSDQHNPKVSKRMTMKEFVSNTAHSLNCDDITEKSLEEMFEEIHAKPFVFSNKSNTFMPNSDPKFHGYLEKRSDHSFSRWKKHYFVMANSCLFYFTDDNPANKDKPRGMIQLIEVEVVGEPRNPLMIHIIATHQAIQYVKFTKKYPNFVNGIKEITFKAPDRASAAIWLRWMKRSAIMSCFKKGSHEEIGNNFEMNEIPEVDNSLIH